MTWTTAPAALRVRQWLHFVPLPLASMAVLTPGRVALACTATAASLAFAWGINSIADRLGDDPAKNPIAGHVRVGRELPALLAALVLLALILSAALGLSALVAMFASLASGALYSAGPRLKRWPGAGLVANTLIFVPLLALGLDDRVAHAAFPMLLAVFTALLLQNQLLHELADADEDARSEVLTTARALGVRGTLALVFTFGVVGAAVAGTLAQSFLPALAMLACTLVPFAPNTGLGTASGGAAVLATSWSRVRLAHRVACVIAGALLFAWGRVS
ncbi:MAG: hypothetical protein U0228_04100 [Myxococcaceae bacterium]